MGLFRKKPKETKVTLHTEKTIDASNMTGLGEEIMETLKEHGIEPGQKMVISAGEVTGLTEEIMGALDQAGVWQQAFSAAGEAHDDPVEQLAKLAELHKQGGLSDYEFAVAKEKLLGENWEAST